MAEAELQDASVAFNRVFAEHVVDLGRRMAEIGLDILPQVEPLDMEWGREQAYARRHPTRTCGSIFNSPPKLRLRLPNSARAEARSRPRNSGHSTSV